LGTLSMYAFVCNFAQAAVAPALNFWNASFPTAPRELEDLMRLVAVSGFRSLHQLGAKALDL